MKFQHPLDESKTLHYEQPLTDKHLLFVQGRILNQKYINLPPEWEGLVNPSTITVHLTSIGANQSLIVKRVQGLPFILIQMDFPPIFII